MIVEAMSPLRSMFLIYSNLKDGNAHSALISRNYQLLCNSMLVTSQRYAGVVLAM